MCTRGSERSACSGARAPLERLRSLDLLRALATLEMVVGHTLHATLLPAVYEGTGLAWWRGVRGHTAVAFMFAAGAVLGFRLMALRDAPHGIRQRAWRKRLRRYALILVLGYMLRFPVHGLLHPPTPWWRAFGSIWQVDVLQCIAISLVLADLILRRFGMGVGAVVLAVLGLPLVALGGAALSVPLLGLEPIDSYLSVAHGSPFPLIPWAGFLWFGAAVGVVLARAQLRFPRLRFWRGEFALWAALVLAAGLLTGVARALELGGSYRLERLIWVALAAGVCAVVVGLWGKLPTMLDWVSRNSLEIYFIHIHLVYSGRVGVRDWAGKRLDLGEALGVALAILALSCVATLALHWLLRAVRRQGRPKALRWSVQRESRGGDG